MIAKLTRKGRVTPPKAIRDRMGLDTGALLDFQLQLDGTVTVWAVKPGARRMSGRLRSPRATAPTVEHMDEGIARYLQRKHG